MLWLAAPLAAGPGEKKEGAQGPQFNPVARMMQRIGQIELTDAQKEQIAKIEKEFTAKFEELRKGQSRPELTAEQRQAMRAAKEKAEAEGKQGKELWEAVQAAVPRTEEQKAAMAKSAEAMQAVHQELMTAVMAVLTDEQKQALKPQKRPAGDKPARNKEPRPEKKPAKAPAP
jgi:hypothetical protein